MNLAQQLDKALLDCVYEETLKGPNGLVAQASQRLASGAPAIRDVKQQTYAFLSDKSDDDRAVIVFISDSKQPDVLKVTGNRQRKIGRPKGAKNGQNNQTVEYNNGVDFSNLTNGAIRRPRGNAVGFPKQVKTGRAVPMPTEGWWITALRSAVSVFN